jgi:hypothetical protein
MPRFSLSHHTGSGKGDHYDFMLEREDSLQTWRLQHTSFLNPQTVIQVKDHRKTYLDFEGEVSGDRGRVRLWDTGTFTFEEDRPGRLRVALSGKQVRTRLLLQRTQESPDPEAIPWTAVDATTEVRKLASALLRGRALEDAPADELAPLREALLVEEQKILAQVDRYAHGGPVEWPLVEPAAEVYQKIDREKTRWQHPWLAEAKKYADRLAELTRILRQQQPS